ncbi:phage tail tape measure protein [Ralstonia pseudosolanacearum]
MASEFYIGVKIGATMLASFGSALAGAKTTMTGLGRVADGLQAKHTRLGEVMARAMAHPARNVGELRRQYEQLGRTIEAVATRQATLAARLASGETLRQQRVGLGAEMVGTYLTAKATAAPLIGAVKQAASFEASLRDIAITGNLTKQEEFRVGEAIRKAALSTNQGHAAILEGVGTLVAAGMDANKAGAYSALLGKVATATNADMKDLAGMVYSLSETLGIKGDAALKEAFNRAAFGGKLGRFELKDMAKALPEMTAAFASKGIKGQEALTQIISSLEVGREGAGTGDEAVTNLRNWLSHMNAKHTIDAYTKAGVDYQRSMQNLVAGGYSSYEASLEIAQKFIATRGDAFMKQWKAAGAKGDEEAQRRLMESFGLNEVFQDIQTINHLLAMRQGWDKYQDNKRKMGQEAMGTIDQDYQKRAELAAKAWEQFKTRVADVGITVGNALLPSLTSLLNTLTPMIGKIGQFAAAHPGVIRAVAGVAVSVVGLKVATLALGWGLNFFVKSPLNLLGTALATASAKWTLLRALVLGGAPRLATVFQLFGVGAGTAAKLAAGFGRLGGLLLSLGRGALTFGRFLVPFGQGLLRTFGGPLMLAGRGVLFLGRLLIGNLVPGLRLAGQAVFWLGRALLLNPIGLAVTAIGVAAYLVWRNWDKIKTAVLAGWNWLKGLKNQFFAAGADIINGLVNGVTSKLASARDSVVAVGSGIKSWFANTLGIKSPSRVFMSFGDNIAQGAAIGIGRSAKLASGAAASMASDAVAAAAAHRVNAGRAVAGAAGAAATNASGMSIHFSPTIQVQGGSAEGVKGQITEALNLSLRDLEQMIMRVTAQQARRTY